jgi:HEAT repeat protein
MQNWIRDILEIRRSGHNGELFTFANRDYRRKEVLFLPDHTESITDMGDAGDLSMEYLDTEREAEQLRRSIIDESLPLMGKLIYMTRKKFMPVGRIGNATLLGLIRYHQALPELREALLHDFSSQLRAECAEAIGATGKHAKKCVSDLSRVLVSLNPYNCRDYVRSNVAKSLEQIGDPSCSPFLKDAIRIAIAELMLYQREDYKGNSEKSFTISDSTFFFEGALKALYSFDPPAAKEAMVEAKKTGNGFVLHHIKKACLLAGIKPR